MRRRLNLNYKRSKLHLLFEKIYKYNFCDPDEETINKFKERLPEKKTKNVNMTIIKSHDQVYV